MISKGQVSPVPDPELPLANHSHSHSPTIGSRVCAYVVVCEGQPLDVLLAWVNLKF